MRYTTDSKKEAQEEMVPLWPYHLLRLKEAHAYFRMRDGEKWGVWPGDDVVWGEVKGKLEGVENGDYRVRPLSDSKVVELIDRSDYYFIQGQSSKFKHYRLLLIPVGLHSTLDIDADLMGRSVPTSHTGRKG